MINHVRTLLLNRMPASDDLEYVDPTYTPIALPAWLSDVQELIVPQQLSTQDAAQRVLQVLQLVHNLDLVKYTKMFDPRIAYSFTDNAFKDLRLTTIADVGLDIPLLLERLEQHDRGSRGGDTVFAAWSEYQAQLDDLRIIWYQSSEALNRIGAYLLAYCVQVERVRRGVSFRNPNTTTIARVI